jgi:hypothetical protein
MGFRDFVDRQNRIYNGKEISRTKVLGVRTSMKSGVLSEVNSGVYAFLIEFTDGSHEIAEEGYNSARFKQFVSFIEW